MKCRQINRHDYQTHAYQIIQAEKTTKRANIKHKNKYIKKLK